MNRKGTPADLEVELMREHSRRHTVRLAAFIGGDSDRFGTLMKIVLAGGEPTARRASWVMSLCVEHTPSLAAPWIRQMISLMTGGKAHSAVQRNIMRSLQFIPIPSSSRGRTVDLCIGLLTSPKTEIAVKAFSMTVLAHIVRNEPELRSEAVYVIEPLAEFGSAGVRSRARKVLKSLKN